MNGLATGLYYKIYLFEPVARSFPFLSSSSSNQPPISKQQYLMTISHLKARIPIKTYFIKHHPTCVWNNAIYSLVGIRSFTQSPSQNADYDSKATCGPRIVLITYCTSGIFLTLVRRVAFSRRSLLDVRQKRRQEMHPMIINDCIRSLSVEDTQTKIYTEVRFVPTYIA